MVLSSSGRYISSSNVRVPNRATPYQPNFGDKQITAAKHPPSVVKVPVHQFPTAPPPVQELALLNNNINLQNNSVDKYIRPAQETVHTNTEEKREMPLLPLAIDTAGYWATDRILYGAGEANDMKDVGLFIAADFIALYGFKDYVKKLLSQISGIDSSTYNEQMIMDYVSDLIAVMGPYILLDMFLGYNKSKVHLAVGVSGAYIVDKLYFNIMGQRSGGVKPTAY